MNESYEEILEGEKILRRPPGARHELICRRLHDWVHASVADLTGTRLLPVRTQVAVTSGTRVCPDLALVAVPTGKLWLAAEVVSSDDHRVDTVVKKEIYEAIRLPRLWMIDPRYDNVEVYHGTAHGLVLKGILAGREVLAEKLIPEFQLTVMELFGAPN
jgi:Uma2 family endonuclease